jgi:hypothetical protein
MGKPVSVGCVPSQGYPRYVRARVTPIIYGTYTSYTGGFSRGEDGGFWRRGEARADRSGQKANRPLMLYTRTPARGEGDQAFAKGQTTCP